MAEVPPLIVKVQTEAPSPKNSLNSTDAYRILRMLLIIMIGMLASYGPALLNMHYVFHGVDYTQLVLPIVSGAIETARRYKNGPGNGTTN